MGGMYSSAHSLIHQLKAHGRHVHCLMGATLEELSDSEKEDMKLLHVDVLEPDTEDEELMSPEERLTHSDSFELVFGNVLPVLETCDRLVSFSKVTHELARYLMHSAEASDCELVLFNLENNRSQEEMYQLAELASTAKDVFSVGYKAFRSLNTSMRALTNCVNNSLLIPDHEEMFSDGESKHVIEVMSGTNCIFIPWSGKSGSEFAKNCLCAVNMCNATFQKTGLIDNTIDVVIQDQNRKTADNDFATCSTTSHVHQYFSVVNCSCKQDLVTAARCSSIVIAGGNFTETGYSGLKFLMNGYVTLVPDGTDVADILHAASPGFASAFILDPIDGLTKSQKQAALLEWEDKICSTIRGIKDLKEKIPVLVKNIQEYSTFKEGRYHLLRAFDGEFLLFFL